MMDLFALTAIGRVGKTFGIRTDSKGETFYKFSMATHRQTGRNQSTLWLQVSAYYGLCEIIAERGLSVGELVAIQSDFGEIAATVQGTKAMGWLNVVASQVTFLSEIKAEPLTPLLPARQDAQTNVIDYQQFMKQKVG